MKRFTKYMDREIIHDNVKKQEKLEEFFISCRYLPDPPEAFDEYEFGIDYQATQDMAVAVTIEEGLIRRMLFGATVPDNPDILKPLSDGELDKLLEKRGEVLTQFLDFITR